MYLQNRWRSLVMCMPRNINLRRTWAHEWATDQSWGHVVAPSWPLQCNQIKIGHSSHDKWTTIVTSAKQHQLIPRERLALVLKDDPRGSSFKGEIFGPHSILMKGSGIFKNTLGSPLAVLNGPTSCTATLIIWHLRRLVQWTDAGTLTVWTGGRR